MTDDARWGGRRPGAGRKAKPLLARKPSGGKVAVRIDLETAATLQRLMLREWPSGINTPEELVAYAVRRLAREVSMMTLEEAKKIITLLRNGSGAPEPHPYANLPQYRNRELPVVVMPQLQEAAAQIDLDSLRPDGVSIGGGSADDSLRGFGAIVQSACFIDKYGRTISFVAPYFDHGELWIGNTSHVFRRAILRQRPAPLDETGQAPPLAWQWRCFKEDF